MLPVTAKPFRELLALSYPHPQWLPSMCFPEPFTWFLLRLCNLTVVLLQTTPTHAGPQSSRTFNWLLALCLIQTPTSVIIAIEQGAGHNNPWGQDSRLGRVGCPSSYSASSCHTVTLCGKNPWPISEGLFSSLLDVLTVPMAAYYTMTWN